jgi:ABC-type lipopolysaccharide export system ATPase subunit
MLDEVLSGGERKRVELASIAALHPRCAWFWQPLRAVMVRPERYPDMKVTFVLD